MLCPQGKMWNFEDDKQSKDQTPSAHTQTSQTSKTWHKRSKVSDCALKMLFLWNSLWWYVCGLCAVLIVFLHTSFCPQCTSIISPQTIGKCNFFSLNEWVGEHMNVHSGDVCLFLGAKHAVHTDMLNQQKGQTVWSREGGL